MVKNVAHFADIHVSNDINRHAEYNVQFEKIYGMLTAMSPDRIVISGDLFDDKLNVNNEAKKLAGSIINNLSSIAPVILTIGNHDLNMKSVARLSSTDVLISLINNKNVTYLTKSGFFPDDNIVWVNHSHLQKKVNPWLHIPHDRDEDKVYIDLFHDPINSCIMDNGTVANKPSYRKMSDFRGDFGMFGDIHMHQYLNDTKTHAYCSSTIQQNFGEHPTEHGFMMWDVISGESELVVVPNDHTMITLYVNEGYDYDNINLDDQHATKNSSFRVKWTDLYPLVNMENEGKIKKYVRDKWNDNQIKFQKVKIFQNIANTRRLTESVNINDRTVQQEVFREYLTMNKFTAEAIDEILSIDDIINSRLDTTDEYSNVTWGIDRFWVDNFKSYSNIDVDWSGIHGIVKIDGKNQHGKSTLLDAISYILFGTTLYTNKLGGAKVEKHKDNRYINNKRDLDYCSGGAVIDINGAKFTILRKTERTWGRGKKSISSCSTSVEYYRGVVISDEFKEVGENRIQTQKMVDTVIGDFEDFVRMSLTTADNLNSILSIDRAKFIDAIIKDAGYDIFERKLEELKSYKKEVETNNIKINLDESNRLVASNTASIDLITGELSILTDNIVKVNREIDALVRRKETELKKMTPIDANIASVDVASISNDIDRNNNLITEYNDTISSNSGKMVGLISEFDTTVIDSMYRELKDIDDDIIGKKMVISQTQTAIQAEVNTAERVDNKIAELVRSEVESLKQSIDVKKGLIRDATTTHDTNVRDYIQSINDKVRDKRSDIKSIDVELTGIKERGSDMKKRIAEEEASDKCLACDRVYDDEHLKHRDELVSRLRSEMAVLFDKAKELMSAKTIIEQEIVGLMSDIDDIKAGKLVGNLTSSHDVMTSTISGIEGEILVINTNIINISGGTSYESSPKLVESIQKGLGIKKASLDKIKTMEDDILSIIGDISKLEGVSIELNRSISKLESDRESFNTLTELKRTNSELSLKVENVILTIETLGARVDKYKSQLDAMEKNKVVQVEVDTITSLLSASTTERDELSVEMNKLTTDITILRKETDRISSDIVKYTKQVKLDELLRSYMTCVHRDGIPNMLILKSKDLINQEISDLLVDCDFDVYLDDDIELKLVSDLSPGIEQPLISSCGKERTFGAVAMKLSLRTINSKSKNNFIFFDEIYGKLDADSVSDFNELLESSKRNLDKIIIIEHHADIQADCVFNVTRDSSGISSLEINTY